MFSSGVGRSSLTKSMPVRRGSSSSNRFSTPELQAETARRPAVRKKSIQTKEYPRMSPLEREPQKIEALYRNTEPLFLLYFRQYPAICTRLGLVSSARCGIGNITLYAADAGFAS